MTLFIAIAVAMLALACAWVLVPLLRQRGHIDIEGEASNLSVLRDQRVELEADLDNGVLSPEQVDAARLELERRVLEETQGAPSAPRSHAPAPLTVAVIAAAFPIAAVALYLVLGNPSALSPQTLAADPAHAGGSPVSAAEIEAMIDKVKARLASDPGNLDGWVVLARTYYALGRAPEAAGAFERAVALAPVNADLLADYADALGMTQQQSLEGRPAELIAQALKADPNQWKANALAGTIAFQRKDYAKAIEHWERVKANVPPQSPVAESIDASLAEARKLGGSAGTPLAKAPAAAATPPAMAAPAPSNAAAPRAPAPAAAAPRQPLPPDTASAAAKVTGTVSIAPALAASVSPDDTVFIFARPADGSRMPLALIRAKARDLPLAFTLDDTQAMTPTHRLSTHAQVIVGARVSRSGMATPQPGDSETTTSPVKVGEAGLALVIDRKLP